MYQLFSRRFESANSVIRPPGFELVRRIYHRELAAIKEYYNSRVFAVKGNHLLCRLITTGFSASNYDTARFMESVYARAPYVAKHFNFTSEITNGKIFDGVFYGEGCSEIILYNEDYFNPFDGIVNWKSLNPIEVLEHPISDFGLQLPDGDRNSTAKGLAVITVNVAMLYAMYRGFLLDRFTHQYQSQLSVEHFIHMYVLPNMLQSHIEIVLFNRLKNLYYGAPMSQSLKKHAIMVVDASDKADHSLNDLIEHMEGTTRQYFQYLKTIPSFFKEDMQECLLMPDIAKTRQVWWSLILTRIDTMKFLIDIGGEKGRAANMSYINKLKLDIKQLNRENILGLVLPKDLVADYQSTFDEISRTT